MGISQYKWCNLKLNTRLIFEKFFHTFVIQISVHVKIETAFIIKKDIFADISFFVDIFINKVSEFLSQLLFHSFEEDITVSNETEWVMHIFKSFDMFFWKLALPDIIWYKRTLMLGLRVIMNDFRLRFRLRLRLWLKFILSLDGFGLCRDELLFVEV